MPVKTYLWDPSEYLDDDTSIEAYLAAAFEDGDPRLMIAAIGDVARARGMSQIARETGLARESLYRALSDEGNPGFDTVVKVIKALKITLKPFLIDKINHISAYTEVKYNIYNTISPVEINVNVINIIINIALGDENDRKRSVLKITGPVSSTRIRSENNTPSY